MKIAVAVPSHDNVPFLFAYDLASMVMWTASVMPEDVTMGLEAVTGTYIHKARQELTDHIVEGEVDFVLFLDSDMRFPRDTFIQLFQRDLPVVGANYSMRGFPAEFVALKKVGEDDGERLETTPDSEGVEEVEALGFGCVLLRRDAFENLPDPEETPWFQNIHLGGTTWMGEDVFFCQLLREAGVPIHVDHDLSKQVSHIGQYEYDITAPLASKEVLGSRHGDDH